MTTLLKRAINKLMAQRQREHDEKVEQIIRAKTISDPAQFVESVRDWTAIDFLPEDLERLKALAYETKVLREALEPLARLELPQRPRGNSGIYGIRHADIRRAKEVLQEEKS